ncbi:UHRF1-binding protein 1, partial [Callorhinchus milii]|uniref:UHRF1-binding protein 1 n=1 Tax=Callorhinchus milii TaxID=7868 RepID=UPI001C3FCF14
CDRFAKNLSPDKINLSTLKGEGQLTNLELDEEVLQNVLDLPTWLAITRVYCNKAAIRIQWTKLKTHPICLFLDKVEVEMRTCEEPRAPNGPSPIAIAAGQSEYGFAEKVVEGMSIVVNSIVIKIQAKAFNASFELWQLHGYSVNPKWQQSDLRFTRIADSERGEVLTFKEITWQTLRIEADAIHSDQSFLSTPLRLITNQSKIRLVLKRRVKDCNVVASKLMFILDDLLWVLTDSQLKAMIKYAQSLSEAIENSAKQRKSMVPDTAGTIGPAPSTQQTRPQPSSTSSSSKSISQYFENHDVKESSYHTTISRLDLHICDDGVSNEQGKSKHGVTGGAMQLTFRKLSMDCYPFHWASDSCKHWVQHCEAMETRARWAKKLLQDFQSKIEAIIDHDDSTTAIISPTKESPTKRAEASPTQKPSAPGKGQAFDKSSMAAPSPRHPPWDRLRSSCVVIRVEDLNIFQVSAAGQQGKKPRTLLSCNRQNYHLPTGISAIHIEFTEYYFPDSKAFPVPCPNLYVQLNTLQFTLDPTSMLWMNTFSLDLYQTLQQFKAIYKLDDSGKADEHVNFCMNGLMLKFVIPVEKKEMDHPDRPQYLTIQTSDMVATNTRHSVNCMYQDLQSVLMDFQNSEFFDSTYKEFPKSANSFNVLHNMFLQHVSEPQTYMERLHADLNLAFDSLKAPSAADIWSIHFAQLWLEFEGMQSSKSKPFSFVDPYPLSIWVSQPTRFQQYKDRKTLPSHRAPEDTVNSDDLDHRRNLFRNTEPSVENGSLGGTRQKIMDDKFTSFRKADKGLNTEPVGVKESNMNDNSDADIHVLVYTSAHIKSYLNHYQYLVLLRLKECLTQLQEDMALDIERVIGAPAKHHTSCIGVWVKSAEVALLLHPVPTSPSDAKSQDSESTSLAESELSPSGSKESLALEDRSLNRTPASNPLDSTVNSLEDSGIHNGDSSLAASSDHLSQYCAATGSLLPPSGTEGTEYHSVEKELVEEAYEAVESTCDSDVPTELIPLTNTEAEAASPLSSTKDAAKEALNVTVDLTKGAVSLTKDAFCFGKERVASTVQRMLSVSASREYLSRGEDTISSSSSSSKLRLLNVKRTTSQHSLDTTSLDGSLTDDRISMDSDSSENYVMLMDTESGQESLLSDGSLHRAAVAGSNQSLSECADGGASKKASIATSSSTHSQEIADPQQASVLVLKILDVNCAIDMRGDDLSFGVQAKEVIPEQLGNVDVEQYMSRHSTGYGKPSCGESERAQPAVSFHFECGPGSAEHSPLAVKNGFLHFHISDYEVEFLMSSLTNLGPFLEDEVIPEVIPMKIELSECRITLKDDGPPLYPTSPGPIPIRLDIDHLVIQRIDDGTFCMKVDSQNKDNLMPLKNHLVRMGSDKRGEESPETGKPSALIGGRLPSDLASTVSKEMNDLLRQELASTKAALTKANHDRDRLLQEIRKLNPEFDL